MDNSTSKKTVSKVEAMLERLGQKKSGGQKKKTESRFLKVEVSKKYVFRLIPDVDDDFVKMYAHHYNVGERSFVCPEETYGQKCPLCYFIARNYKKSTPQTQAKFKQISSSRRLFSLVLNREDNKVYIWSYSEKVAVKLLTFLREKEEYGNIADPENGRDLILTSSPVASGKKYPEYDLNVKMSTSPLIGSEGNPKLLDKEAYEGIMENLPEIEKELNFLSSEEIEQELIAWSRTGIEEEKPKEEEAKEEEDESPVETAEAGPDGDIPF